MDTIIWLDGHTSKISSKEANSKSYNIITLRIVCHSLLFQQVLEERDRLNVSATYITLVHMEILVISKSSSN